MVKYTSIANKNYMSINDIKKTANFIRDAYFCGTKCIHFDRLF